MYKLGPYRILCLPQRVVFHLADSIRKTPSNPVRNAAGHSYCGPYWILHLPWRVIFNLADSIMNILSNPARSKAVCSYGPQIKVPPEGYFNLWTIPDSNRLPLPCHGSALPIELMALNHQIIQIFIIFASLNIYATIF